MSFLYYLYDVIKLAINENRCKNTIFLGTKKKKGKK